MEVADINGNRLPNNNEIQVEEVPTVKKGRPSKQKKLFDDGNRLPNNKEIQVEEVPTLKRKGRPSKQI